MRGQEITAAMAPPVIGMRDAGTSGPHAHKIQQLPKARRN